MSRNRRFSIQGPLPISQAVEFQIAEMRRKLEAGEYDVADDEVPAQEAARQSLIKLKLQLGDKYRPDRIGLGPKQYAVYHKAQKPVLDRVLTILEQLPDLIEQGRNIIWYGTVGTGKDHMCCSLLYHAAQLGFDVAWRNVQRLYESSRDAIKRESPERMLIEELLRPRVLALSDPRPPKGEPTPWNVNLLYRVLDERGRALRATWITCNVAQAKGADDPTPEQQLAESLSAPVWDRMRENAEVLPCFWPSFRGRGK